ncbi:M48 family metallopeptidase [Rubeoparvulum massiliense]|uniref:M48 family metallopeptidase n=1 Tax=Rubeoparvulum massiliense TaxID=1631346 RepID=UPI00065E4586|nr:SprT family zinc-dependent metalloprotease [Rubeoparvulum massiliense]
MLRHITLPNALTIQYEVIFRRRKTAEIRIQPGGTVMITVPLHTSEAAITELFVKKQRWITERLEAMKQRREAMSTHQFMSGEPFLYLGQVLTLQVNIDPAHKRKKPYITFTADHLVNGQFIVTLGEEDPIAIRTALEQWYRKQTFDIVNERIQHYQPLIQRQPSHVQVKEQKRRWGSCSSAGKLMFNWRISMAPLEILDYIVVHEMCHLIHMNHSHYFWQLVESILPDYHQQNDWLKEQGWRLDLEQYFIIFRGSSSMIY